MLLSRTVRRELPRGQALVVRRTYEIRFVSNDGGYSVEGRLLDCSVEAPPALNALAEIERNRPDTGLFPLTLDRRGIILPVAVGGQGKAFDEASRVIADMVSNKVSDTAEQVAAHKFVKQFGSQVAVGLWPEDLFVPASSQHAEDSVVPLADGQSGRVQVLIEATRNPQNALLSRFNRTVITDFGGIQRRSDEEWTLSAN